MVLSTITGTAVPRSYQLDGVAWLRDGMRKFLTDEFGLGKTKQSVWATAMGLEAHAWPVLVATRQHLLYLWKREILSCYPTAKVVLADAAGTAQRQAQFAITRVGITTARGLTVLMPSHHRSVPCKCSGLASSHCAVDSMPISALIPIGRAVALDDRM